MHKITLEQWALLEKVVELGSSTRAAGGANRSQSLVSHNPVPLQGRLGVTLPAPSSRRAMLIPAGELLLNQVKPLPQAFAYIETHAATLCNGVRTRLDLVVDSTFPRQRLLAILRQFQQRYLQAQVRLTEVLENVDDESAARTEVDVMMLTRRQGITGRGKWLMNVDFIAAAHHDHPLAALDGPLEDSTLAPWSPVRTAGQTGDGQATRDAWTLSTTDAAVDAVMHQVGFGWLPEECIRLHLDQGMLKRLLLSHDARHATPLHLIVEWDPAPTDEQVVTLLGLSQVP